MTVHHAVWIDDRDAKVFCLEREDLADFPAWSPEPAPVHLRAMHGDLGHHAGHPGEEDHFFVEVWGALSSARDVLVLGPGEAKHRFAAFARRHAPDQAAKVAAVEDLDHPSDRQVVAAARGWFGRRDLRRAEAVR